MSSGVRPLDVEPEPPRRGVLLATAAVVVLAGFGVYLASGGLSEDVPTTTAGPTTTSAPPAGDSEGPAETLRQLVPGFQGHVRGVQTPDNLAFAWTWSSGESAPRLVPLPDGASGSWDVALDRLAVTAESAFGRSLFYGPAVDVREVHNGVESFAWHSSQPDSLAWLSVPQADGMRELWRSLPQSSDAARAFSASLVTRLDLNATLVGYGDWGFALTSVSPSEDRPLQLVTLDPAGTLIAQASYNYLDDLGDGRLLAILPGADPQLVIVDTGLGIADPIGPSPAFGGVLSPNADWVAYVTILDSGATLVLARVGGESERTIPLGVDVALPAAWSSDGHWVLLVASPDAPASSDLTQLLFVDTTEHAVYFVTAAGAVSGLSIEAIGGVGPSDSFAGDT